MAVKEFRELDAWQVAMKLAMSVYQLVAWLPSDERFEMASQMRRAALSVPSNIAEGFGTRLRGRYRYHVRISLGSVAELMTCVELGHRLGYWDAQTTRLLNNELSRMAQLLNGVLRSIKRQNAAAAATGAMVILACLLIW